ncbi:MAG: hypothetical protein P0Y55_13585 [Candidatus Cohnella colombiensis]|uniref:Uncharacterized protein n=1 Tax=Candidatus Cohnella colombiensis TaxID=3121368 RepID=A0AA95JET8_9BACL|nr:MAG: hypothetical protein P0Y55_13585 [Cohnella sp.]
MNEPYKSHFRGWTPGEQIFPGIEQSVTSGPPAVINPTTVVSTEALTAPKSGLPFNFSVSNLSDIKNIVERMGGIDGVLATMGKVQKFVTTMQQFAPMIQLFMKKKNTDSTSSSGSGGRVRRRRRRTRRTAVKRRISKKRS